MDVHRCGLAAGTCSIPVRDSFLSEVFSGFFLNRKMNVGKLLALVITFIIFAVFGTIVWINVVYCLNACVISEEALTLSWSLAHMALYGQKSMYMIHRYTLEHSSGGSSEVWKTRLFEIPFPVLCHHSFDKVNLFPDIHQSILDCQMFASLQMVRVVTVNWLLRNGEENSLNHIHHLMNHQIHEAHLHHCS